jgi:hypothetical protein
VFWGFGCVYDPFYWMKHGREKRAGSSLFGITLEKPTEVTSPNIANATFKQTLSSKAIHN